MSTPNRIMLVDSWGYELFSGSSILSSEASPQTLFVSPRDNERPASEAVVPPEGPPMEPEDDEECEPVPETLRSSVFVRTYEPTSRPIVIEEVGGNHRAA